MGEEAKTLADVLRQAIRASGVSQQEISRRVASPRQSLGGSCPASAISRYALPPSWRPTLAWSAERAELERKPYHEHELLCPIHENISASINLMYRLA
jgi:hypothetical protein